MKKWIILAASLLVIALLLTALFVFHGDPNPTEPDPGTSEPTEDKCTITFYNNGKVYETIEVAKGASLTLPKAPKGETGKGLYGWTTIDGDMEEVIDPVTFVVNADLKLYALWADAYDVVINADNGTPFTVLKVFAGTIIEKPADPVKEGYRFVEWRDALNEVPFDFAQPIYADVTIKAMYGDGAANRVSDTKWDFSTGVHGGWIGDQGAWGRVEGGIPAADMVYTTVSEDGYAGWGYVKADKDGNIPSEATDQADGFGMKILGNEGISVEASKAKLVVIYLKTKYYPIDVFRISVLTSNGGKFYGYGSGQEDWAIRTDTANKDLVQVDMMEDGWYRVQFKIHGLPIWSEDAVVKGFSFGFVQRPSTPVMDVVYVKSIELLDQEEFIDPHKIEHITKDHWDMSNADDSKDWVGAQGNGSNTSSVTTKVGKDGTTYVFSHTNAWRGLTLTQAKIDMSKLSDVFSVTINADGMAPTDYRIYIKTDAGGDLYKNNLEDVSCYYATTKAAELNEGWSMVANADGTITISYDLTKLEYWNKGTTLLGLTFVTVDSTANGTITYKSISLVDEAVKHDCKEDGHRWLNATCVSPKTCSVCGATDGNALGHSWKNATCTTPKTCSRCGATDGEARGHNWEEGVCTDCGEVKVEEVPGPAWDMSKAEDSAQWISVQNKTATNTSTITVTENGSVVTYNHPNAWKGIVLKNQELNINELSGKLYVTYSSGMGITQYRIYVLTDVGGDLAYNDEATFGFAPANYYAAMTVADIAGNANWTYTENADGTVTVSFDLNSLPFFANGNVLRGLTFCTVTGSETGEVLYKHIELTGKSTASSKDACDINGHTFKDATCTSPKTCSVCGATEGEPLGHTWTDATCTCPKTCSVCKATEGEALGHTWVEATCTTPKTCSVCGETEGDVAHHYVDGICSDCGAYETPPVTQNSWDMTKAEDSGHWVSLQDKTLTDTSTIAVTEAGSTVTYSNANAWKGIRLSNGMIDINELTSHVTFTYSSGLSISQYRIYILTDQGGDLAYNDEATSGYAPANYYAAIKLTEIAGSTAWTSKTNEDGSITVTFDLTTLPFYEEGTVLKGLTIVTVANGTGDVTYRSIALTERPAHDCETDGHIYENGVCIHCGAEEPLTFTQDSWDMSKAEDSAQWYSVQNKTATNTSSITVTSDGSVVAYNHTNPWKGIRAENTTIDISKLSGVLSFTYSSQMSITNYRIYILTDQGGHLAENAEANSGYAPANYYADIKLSDIAGNTAWTSTTNEDGSITVTFDLSTLPFYEEGTVLKGLTIVTVTAANNTGNVTYRSIELERIPLYTWDMSNADASAQWYGVQNKTVTNTSTIEVTEAGSIVSYAAANPWKGLRIEQTAVDIGSVSGTLTVTYSSELSVTQYRVYILTDKGGNLADNALSDKASYVSEINISDITEGSAWTRTENADGSVTITFDLTTLAYWSEGTTLEGLTFVTVANGTGSVTYKSIAIY